MTRYELVRRPSRRSLLAPGLVGGIAAAAAMAGGDVPGVATAAGVFVLLSGVITGTHRTVDAGGFVAFLGVVMSALSGASAVPVVLGTVACVVAWDTGTTAVSLGAQLGRGADTTRVEVVHAVLGGTVGLTAGVVGLLLFRVGPGRQPVATLFVLLLATAILLVALRR